MILKIVNVLVWVLGLFFVAFGWFYDKDEQSRLKHQLLGMLLFIVSIIISLCR